MTLIVLGEIAPGQPEVIRQRGSELQFIAGVLEGQARAAAECAMPVWQGLAAQAFADRLRPLSPILSAAAERYGVAAQVLGRYADALASLQAAQRALLARAGEANQAEVARRHESGKATLADYSPGAPALGGAVFDAATDQFTATRAELHALWSAALADFHAEDTACAATLHAASDDGVEDTRLYRFLHFMDSAGSAMAVVGVLALAPTPLTPVFMAIGAIGAGLSTISAISTKVGYEEGEWSDIALGVGVSALGGAGKVLKTAGTVTKLADDGARTIAMTNSQRLAAGLRQRYITDSSLNAPEVVRKTREALAERAARAASGDPSAWSTFVASGPAGFAVAGWAKHAGSTAVSIGKDKLKAKVAKDYIEPWRTAKANGNDARRFVETSFKIEGLLKTHKAVTKAMALPGKLATVSETIDKRRQPKSIEGSRPVVAVRCDVP